VGADAAAASDGEGSQVARIPSDVGLVTLTAGGNNLGFPAVLQTCIIAAVVGPISDCGPGSTIEKTIESQFDSLGTELSRVKKDIRARAPHARIVLVGYPYLFPQSPSDCVYNFNGNLLTAAFTGLLKAILGPLGGAVPSSLTYLKASEESWINGIERTANQKLAADAAQSGMEFASIQDAFSGNELCSGSPTDLNGPQMHTATLKYLAAYAKTGHAPQGLLPIEQESFHPTPAGYGVMAGEVEQYLDQPWPVSHVRALASGPTDHPKTAQPASRSTIVSPQGTVGSLTFGSSTQRDIQNVAGTPDATAQGSFGVPNTPDYLALGYQCSHSASRGSLPLTNSNSTYCLNVYYLNTATGHLGAFATTSETFETPQGTKVGMTATEAQQREGRSVVKGCLDGITLWDQATPATVFISVSDAANPTVRELEAEGTSGVGLLFC